MVIRPSNHEPSRRTPAPGMEATPAQPTLPRERAGEAPIPTSSIPKSDRAEVSSEARALFESALKPAIGGSTMAPERMRGILDRIRSGQYDRPEVLDQVAQSIRDEWSGPSEA